VRDFLAPADTFGDIIASQLDMDTAWVCAKLTMDFEETLDFLNHIVEVSCLES
jgi:hypothetical protein